MSRMKDSFWHLDMEVVAHKELILSHLSENNNMDKFIMYRTTDWKRCQRNFSKLKITWEKLCQLYEDN